MRVRHVFAIDVDPDEWNEAFGCGSTEPEVRESVRKYFLEHARNAYVTHKGLATVAPVLRSDRSFAKEATGDV
jgi:hypothetical protein